MARTAVTKILSTQEVLEDPALRAGLVRALQFARGLEVILETKRQHYDLLASAHGWSPEEVAEARQEVLRSIEELSTIVKHYRELRAALPAASNR